MEIPIFSTHDFDKFRKPFKHYFSNPQYRNLTQYLLGLILCEGKRTISHLHRSNSCQVSYNRLHHFVSESPWDHEGLNQLRIEQSIKEIEWQATATEKPVGFIIGDDTTNPKCGIKMPGFGFNYSSTEEKPIRSQCIVSTLYHYSGNDYPLHASLYKSKDSCLVNEETFKTKNQSMVEHIKNTPLPEGIRTIGLFDTIYFNNEVIAACKGKSIDAIGTLKCNRRALVLDSDPVGFRLDKWFHYLRTRKKHPFKQITIKNSKGIKRQVWMLHWTGFIKNLGLVQLIMLTPKLRGKKLSPIFIATTAMDLSPEQIAEYYFRRWSIETFFWTIKEHLGFNHYQVRSEQATIRHWFLVFMAYSYLVQTKKNQDPSFTLGDVKRQKQKENFHYLIEHIHQKIKTQGQNPYAIYSKFAA